MRRLRSRTVARGGARGCNSIIYYQNALFCPTGFRIPDHKHKNNNLLFSPPPLVLYSFSPLPYSCIHLPAVFAPYFSPFPSLSLSHFAACVRSSHCPRVTSCTFSLSSPRPHLCNPLSFSSLTHTPPPPPPIVLRISYSLSSICLSLYLFIHLLLVHFLAGSSSYSLLLLANFLQFLLSLIPSKPVPVYLYFPVSYFHPFSYISLLSGQLQRKNRAPRIWLQKKFKNLTLGPNPKTSEEKFR
jgi:hypothetical protein